MISGVLSQSVSAFFFLDFLCNSSLYCSGTTVRSISSGTRVTETQHNTQNDLGHPTNKYRKHFTLKCIIPHILPLLNYCTSLSSAVTLNVVQLKISINLAGFNQLGLKGVFGSPSLITNESKTRKSSALN